MESEDKWSVDCDPLHLSYKNKSKSCGSKSVSKLIPTPPQTLHAAVRSVLLLAVRPLSNHYHKWLQQPTPRV